MWEDAEQKGYAANALAVGPGTYSISYPTKRQRLGQKKDVLEAQLAKVNKAIEALDKNPDLEEFMNIINAAD